ncbi:MAG: DUF899 domain-containing protein [Alphaproteobacteria bacterium]|nr:DUF899 domain-containing protein [Alphaproteobacteria bacterium]
MEGPKIVSGAEWLAARMAHLEKEKEFTKLRDELSRQRRELPWERVEKDYVFEGPEGAETLSEVFDGRSQLITWHFMYGPTWDEGCPSCSFWADNYDGTDIHLNHRDVSMVAISRAPLNKLEAYKKRMGWRFKWLSSLNNSFNFDYHVSFTQEEMDAEGRYYNYNDSQFPSEEAPGLSVFAKDETGAIFHTYSTFGRGLDMLNAAYHHLDLVPKGRDEAGLPYAMAWVSRHDSYED